MHATVTVTRLPFSRRQITRDRDTQLCLFCSCDLDLDPMTFMYELNLKILKTYLRAEVNYLG